MCYFSILSLVLLSVLTSFSANPVPRLELVWETEPVFSFPESVVYDPQREVLYVSNIGETPEDNPHNGDGFVSILSMDGKLIEKNYIKGLNDPKGMDIWKNTLWINDRDAVVEWDIAANQSRKRYELKNVVFLNDIGIGPKGEVFTNDADGHKVLDLVDGKWQVFWRDAENGRPNGVLVENDRIILTMNWSHQLISIDRNSKKRTLLLDGIGSGDGVEPVGGGAYLVTDYLGRVIYISPKGKGTVLIDTRDEKLSADLEYISDQRLVVIPRHKNHTVAAYRLIWE